MVTNAGGAEVGANLTWSLAGLDLAPPLGYYDNIAVQALGYVHLTAGAHRFSFDCDDGFQMSLGLNLNDPSQLVIADAPSENTSTFDFLVEAEGLHPIQIIWQNSRKNHEFALYSVDLATNTRGPLINDTGSPVQVYSPAAPLIIPMSSTSVGGPYTVEASANQATKTITIPKSGPAKFFRLSAPAATSLAGHIVGSNIVLTYQ